MLQAPTRDYTATITVSQSPQDVFAAITNVRGWWGTDISGRSEQPGDEFTFQHQDIHRSTQRVVEAVPGLRVVWLVTEARLNFTKDPAEWVGSRIVFDIARQDGQTRLRFTHEDLVPGRECYDRCSSAWAYLIEQSLHGLITTGRGTPFN